MHPTDHSARRVATDGFLGKAARIASGHALGYVLALGASPMVARLYGPAAFGVFAIFVASIGCLAAVATCRFDQALLVCRDRRTAGETALAGLTTTLLAACVLLLLSPAISALFDALAGEQVPRLIAPLLAVAIVCVSLYQIVAGWLLRENQYQALAVMRVVLAMATALTQIAVPLAGGSLLLGLAVGQVVGFASGACYGALSSWGLWPPVRFGTWRQAWVQARLHRRFAVFGVPAAMTTNLVIQGPALLLAVLYGVEVAGVYALAQRVFTTPLSMLTNSFSRVYFSEAAATNDAEALRRLFRYTATRVFAIAVGPVALVACLAPWTFGMLFGSHWAAAGTVCALLAPLALAMTVASVVAPTFDVLGRQDQRLVREVLCGLLLVGGLSLAWAAGASAAVAIAALSMAGTLGYVMSLALAWRCVARDTAAHESPVWELRPAA